MPSEMDVVRAREMTRGVSEVKLTTGSLTISLIDVGSQSTETIGKKWISCFENVTAVMFVVDLDCYDQMQLKESSQNGLVKSLLQFESVVNSRWFMRSSIILILNQWDRFKDKLRRSPLANYFSDYSGGDDVNKAAKYILWRFNQVNRARHSIYPHLTQSTDTSTLRVVFAAVKHMILIDFLEKTSWLS
jgi:guanine nucleotide-binding protein subunit alpha